MIPIDPARLNSITDGDISLQQELLGLFFDTVTRTMAVLKETSDGSTRAWREAAHELKGAANTLGFERVGNLCRQVELLNPLPEVGKQAIVQELEAALAEVRTFADRLSGKP